MQKTKDLIHLHFIVLILGFTALLGKLITLPAETIVFWRLLFAVAGLIVVTIIKHKTLHVDKKRLLQYLGVGTIVAIHWITFFTAIKLSNISVTLVCLSSSTLFVSLLEPLFFRKKVSGLQFLLGLAIFIGIALIFKFESEYTDGIIIALFSSVLAALFTVLNKKILGGNDSTIISFYELLGGWCIVTIYLLFAQGIHELSQIPDSQNLLWLAILGILCTSYAYTASVKVMRSLSAYLVVLTINMEPIYGIIIGLLIFKESEIMTTGFYFGALIILISVFIYPLIRKMQNNRTNGSQTLS